MGRCDYCHEETGLLGREHSDCSDAARKLKEFVRSSVVTARPGFSHEYEAASRAGSHKVVEIKPALEGWTAAVERILEDGLLTEQEEKAAFDVAQIVGINQTNAGQTWMKLAKAKILRVAAAGEVPQVAQISGYHANLLKKEKPVWMFNAVSYYEERTYRSFSGVSHGVSIRIMKGVYYRPSMFRGAPVETTRLVHADNGELLVTSHHLYFLGSSRSFRVSYSKIVAFEPYKDAIGIQRDAMTAKPQIFKLDDPWFAYNLVTNLAAIGAV